MSDLYREILVKKQSGSTEKIQKLLLIAVTVLAVAAAIVITPLAWIFVIIMIVVDYMKIPSYDMEFEYLYVNGELDVDKIMAKTKRKHAASYEVEKIEMIAPYQSHELDYFKQGHKGKIVDFSSGVPEKAYAMIYNTEQGQSLVLLDLDSIILDDIRRIAPRKVKLG